jgi:F0F1-type ATP synthase assembly protein I
MRDDPTRKSDPKSGDELSLETFAGAGLQFAIAIVVFLLAGQWADRKFGTSPTFLLIGVFIGGSAAFYSLYRRITKAQKADDERRRMERSSGEKK